MRKQLFILMAALAILVSCNQVKKDENKQADNVEKIEIDQDLSSYFKTIDLDFDFKVILGQEEGFENSKAYTYFKLVRNSNTIYIDSSLTEYDFGNDLFPIVLPIGDNSFELFFEINNRPNKNYLKRFFVKKNKLVRQDKLPVFEAESKDINNDGIKEYAGFWDYSQIWGEKDKFTVYNPILYYSVTKTGLQLDSILTRERNELIYGQFYGFSFNERNEQPISTIAKFEKELNLITNKL